MISEGSCDNVMFQPLVYCHSVSATQIFSETMEKKDVILLLIYITALCVRVCMYVRRHVFICQKKKIQLI